jgi:hypothetical protein
MRGDSLSHCSYRIMKNYWVVGGLYADTRFDRMQDGGKEKKYGPFKTYEEAKAEWQRRAWESVDSACARFRIEEETGDVWYWVVGGPYSDTKFNEPAAGGGEQWHGPYKTYDEAKIEWSRLAWSTVDDAMSRYRIEKLAYGERPRRAS